MIIAFWSGTAAEFRRLSFAQWFGQATANATMVEGMQVRKLEVKHL